MKALLENEVVSLYPQERVMSEFETLIERAKTADAVVKNNIENEIVSGGLKFVPELISHIQNNKGITRGICAMSLIRIGKACVDYIVDAAKNNTEFAWAADYILNEIRA